MGLKFTRAWGYENMKIPQVYMKPKAHYLRADFWLR